MSITVLFHYIVPAIGETELKAVQQFTYLGSTISSNAKIDKEVDNRLTKANRAFGRLYSRVWSNKHLKKGTKVSVYRAVNASTNVASAPSSTFTGVTTLERAEITSIEAMLMKTQLRWAGHVSRMEDHRLPKIVLYGELSAGHRNRGAPKKRYKDSLKKSLQYCNIDYRQCCRPRDMATHSSPASLLLREEPQN
ncbi:hypothetical protein JOB18_009869 [Solea senegalensis]|uniref:Uncharacterized protein n=1 Tax=Solea senegalensis TaxID=28829 RepID=A0AAV6SR73_SOLSE|nr:hypothetical protein JOB18_009869 [Solea senegalensis]